MMKLFRNFIFTTIVVGTLIAINAWGQSNLTSTTLTGNETWSVGLGGPQGPSIFVTSAQIRNSQGIQITSATSGTLSLSNTVASLIKSTAITGAFTVNTPAVPWDGQILEIVNGTASNDSANTTLTASTGQTVNSGTITNQGAGSSKEWRYSQTTTTWYLLR